MAWREGDRWRGEARPNTCSENVSWDAEEENLATPRVESYQVKVGGSKECLRRERLRELVATEHDYVKDLEALLQVSERNETVIVKIHTLIGNTEQVVEMARQLLQELEDINRGSDKEKHLGHLFLRYTEKLSQVYQEYCSQYSVRVLPLLKKYEESDKAMAELGHLAEDLRSLRPNINSFNAALIKPVQRILRYPLYLAHLLEDTPSIHPDFSLLQEAHARLGIAATQINEHTRGLGLACKYHSEVDHSLPAKMRRVSLHSLAKKSIRMSTLVSQRLGIMNETKCIEFEEEETKFHSMHRAVMALVSHITAILEAVRARHISELLISDALGDVLQAPYIQTMKQTTCEAYDNALKAFDATVVERVLWPAGELAAMCEAPARLIHKCHHKKLDYDASNPKQSARCEGNSIKTLMFEEKKKVKAYEALQSLLLAELPVLTIHGQEIIITALHTLVAARLYLQGRIKHIYLQLAQAGDFTYSEPKAAQTRAQQQMEWLLGLLPRGLQKKYASKDHQGTGPLRMKAAPHKNKKTKLHVEHLKSIVNPHPDDPAHQSTFYINVPEAETYTALYSFTAEDDTQLSLHPGEKIVPLFKDGAEGWWFVKTYRGEQGYVPASYLSL